VILKNIESYMNDRIIIRHNLGLVHIIVHGEMTDECFQNETGSVQWKVTIRLRLWSETPSQQLDTSSLHYALAAGPVCVTITCV